MNIPSLSQSDGSFTHVFTGKLRLQADVLGSTRRSGSQCSLLVSIPGSCPFFIWERSAPPPGVRVDVLLHLDDNADVPISPAEPTGRCIRLWAPGGALESRHWHIDTTLTGTLLPPDNSLPPCGTPRYRPGSRSNWSAGGKKTDYFGKLIFCEVVNHELKMRLQFLCFRAALGITKGWMAPESCRLRSRLFFTAFCENPDARFQSESKPPSGPNP